MVHDSDLTHVMPKWGEQHLFSHSIAIANICGELVSEIIVTKIIESKLAFN